MKKLVKALSLLLALVCILSMTVVVSAGTKCLKTPYISASVKQTDHYQRTVSIDVSNLEDVTYLKIKETRTSGAGKYVVSRSVTNPSEGKLTLTYTFKVATNEKDVVKFYVVECYNGTTKLAEKTVYVGSNQYFDIDSLDDGSESRGSYDGLRPSYKEEPASSSDQWTGYQDDKVSYVGIYTVKCNKLNVRAGMSTKSKKVGSIKKGTNVCVYTFNEGWAKILYEGEYCYVSAKYLKLA